ncbi:MAG: 2-dehydropantoate 2-reductase [Acidaminococcus sp.]|nr:2-dehydropantoate 2-reductase [Acidaminococcus sp.]MCI2100903.1 2-dehydropantoate 2-reductase [Acidaminococcus sp.]MCI2117296.1 2-dehydropantoate 2-reductase [Acidaminococcus sp.]
MEIQKVALIGAGGIGSYLIWGLAPHLQDRLFVIADGKRGDKLRRYGITINGENYQLHVASAKETGIMDLIFVTVKYGSLPSVVPSIEKMTGKDTMVISLMNGVDSEEIIADAIGRDHLVGSLLRIAAQRKSHSDGADEVTFKIPEGIRGLYYGKPEPLDAVGKAQMEALGSFFASSRLLTHISHSILSDIWAKYLFNIGQNIPQAIVGCGSGAYGDSEHVRWLKEHLEEEVVAVAKAKGIKLNTAILEAGTGGKGAGYTKKESPAVRHSTLQDLDAHRHTEIDMLCGRMVEMGKELGIPTPYNAFAYHVIKALEEKNDGKFDY